MIPIPKYAITTILGQMGREALLEGQHVFPQKLTASGFRFCGIIDEPVNILSDKLIMLNASEFQIINSSEILEICREQIALGRVFRPAALPQPMKARTIRKDVARTRYNPAGSFRTSPQPVFA